jgi:hypothetical protein
MESGLASIENISLIFDLVVWKEMNLIPWSFSELSSSGCFAVVRETEMQRAMYSFCVMEKGIRAYLEWKCYCGCWSDFGKRWHWYPWGLANYQVVPSRCFVVVRRDRDGDGVGDMRLVEEKGIRPFSNPSFVWLSIWSYVERCTWGVGWLLSCSWWWGAVRKMEL